MRIHYITQIHLRNFEQLLQGILLYSPFLRVFPGGDNIHDPWAAGRTLSTTSGTIRPRKECIFNVGTHIKFTCLPSTGRRPLSTVGGHFSRVLENVFEADENLDLLDSSRSSEVGDKM